MYQKLVLVLSNFYSHARFKNQLHMFWYCKNSAHMYRLKLVTLLLQYLTLIIPPEEVGYTINVALKKLYKSLVL